MSENETVATFEDKVISGYRTIEGEKTAYEDSIRLYATNEDGLRLLLEEKDVAFVVTQCNRMSEVDCRNQHSGTAAIKIEDLSDEDLLDKAFSASEANKRSAGRLFNECAKRGLLAR